MAVRSRRLRKQQKSAGNKLLGRDDVKRIVQIVAGKLGVLDAFNEIISGKKSAQERLDRVDLDKVEGDVANTLVHLGSGSGTKKKVDDEFSDRDMVFDVKEKKFVDKNNEECNAENVSPATGTYAFDIGHLDSYQHVGDANGYRFCREDGSVI